MKSREVKYISRKKIFKGGVTGLHINYNPDKHLTTPDEIKDWISKLQKEAATDLGFPFHEQFHFVFNP